MNKAQRRVLVLGLLFAAAILGLIAVNWLSDGLGYNDGLGLVVLILALGSAISALYIRAGGIHHG